FSQRLLVRKNYSVPGANSMWHHDGNHRLIRWKMLLHIFIYGKTRVVTNIHASNSN
ncbi:hypothetical protein IW261DRAFT_1331602, partial [Armillaria novae-zelandiae]